VQGAAHHKVIALPIKVDGRRSSAMAPPPELGADTHAVLFELNIAADEITRLHRAGVVG
jgi:formyl-CoA transferase/CoA:oxalate CoA-transferase